MTELPGIATAIAITIEVSSAIPPSEAPRIVLSGAREALQAIDPDAHIHIVKTY